MFFNLIKIIVQQYDIQISKTTMYKQCFLFRLWWIWWEYFGGKHCGVPFEKISRCHVSINSCEVCISI